MTADPWHEIKRLIDEAEAVGLDHGEPQPTRAKTGSGWPVVLPSSLQGKPIPERRFCVPDWIPDRTVTLLSGDGGTGKSLLAMQLATCCAMGRPFLGMELAPRKVLYLAAEDDQDEMHRRQVDINDALGIEMAELDDQLAWRVLVGEDTLLAAADKRGRLQATPTYTNLRNYCRENGIQLVIIDTVADTFGGLEIDRQQVTRYVRFAEAIARDNDGAVVLVAHPSVAGLKDGTGISGSSAWRNAVRSVIYMRRPTPEPNGPEVDRDERILERLKANFAPAGGKIELRYDRGHFILNGEGIGVIGTPVHKVFVDHTVLSAIKASIKSGKLPSPSKHSELFYGRALNSFEGMRKLTTREIMAAGERMIANGQLRIAHLGVGKNKRLVLAPANHPPFQDERDPETGARKEA